MFEWFRKKPKNYSFVGQINELGEQQPAAPVTYPSDQFDELSNNSSRPMPIEDSGQYPMFSLADQYLDDRPGYSSGGASELQRIRFYTNHLKAQATAEEDIAEDEIRYGAYSAERRAQLVNRRVKDLFYALCDADMTEHYEFARAVDRADTQLKKNRQHEQTIAAINRSSVAANVLDAAGNFVSAHPFLAGFIGTAAIERIRGK